MWLGYWFSYKPVKKTDLNVFEGLIYAIVPTIAYYSSHIPQGRDYSKVQPLVGVVLDVGVSYLIYRIIVD